MIAALLATLHIMTHNGAVYDVVEKIPSGSCIMGGTETLVFEADTFNTCQDVTLKPGCYRVEMMGGLGGKNAECKDWAEQMITEPLSGMFTLDSETTVYAFRGGDGMPGTVNKSGNYYGSFGGGASGADSVLVVGDRVFRARGANGQSCRGMFVWGLCINGESSSLYQGNGRGAGWVELESGTANNQRFCVNTKPTGNTTFSIRQVGGGGGGAPSGTGGTTWQYNKNCPADTVIDAGADATTAGGGDGGDITNAYYNPDDTTPKNATGGRGGANVTWTCGGQTITVYGGGGGGACINGAYARITNGGDGGSGSTNTSTNSFIRIYKM